MLICLCLKAVVYRKNYSGTYTVCWLMLVGVSLLGQAAVAVSSLQLAGNMHCVSISILLWVNLQYVLYTKLVLPDSVSMCLCEFQLVLS